MPRVIVMKKKRPLKLTTSEKMVTRSHSQEEIDKIAEVTANLSHDELDKVIDNLARATVRTRAANSADQGVPLAASLDPDGGGQECDDSISVTSDDAPVNCSHCTTYVKDGIRCDYCLGWFHFDILCSGLEDKFKKMMSHVNVLYICNKCRAEKPKISKKASETDYIEEKLHIMTEKIREIGEKVDGVTQCMDMVYDRIDTMDEDMKVAINEDTAEIKKKKSYAESLKSKNVLIIKSTKEDQKANEKKKAIMKKIRTPVEQVKETKDGHLAINFADKQKLESAKTELENDQENEISVKEKDKLHPKIKLVNVSKEEEDIIESITTKNAWINNYIEKEDDIKIIKVQKARDETKNHYILKCSPKIRRAILENGDKLYTMYEHCNVYDAYLAFQCYKCQEFGHSAKNCRNDTVCAKCGGDHHIKDCDSTEVKCKNCERKGNEDTKHKTMEVNKCPILKEETLRVKNNTDHGF